MTQTHTHVIDPDQEDRRFPNCICGEFYFTGSRWAAIPDQGAYT